QSCGRLWSRLARPSSRLPHYAGWGAARDAGEKREPGASSSPGVMAERSSEQLTELATELVTRARKAGADVAEASARGGFELSVRVRLGKPELVEEAGHHSVSLRVIKAQRVASTSTSDLSASGIERCVEDALSLVELSEPDPFAGPADPALLCSPPHPDLDLFDPAVGAIDAEQAILQATAAEAAAFAADPRITLSEGANFSRTDGISAVVLSSGFSGLLRGSYAMLWISPVAEDEGGKKRRGHYWTAHRYAAQMEPAAAVGREAARRTVAKLGARKIQTCEAPIVFDPDVARSVLGSFASCIVGGALFRRSSYLLEREGTEVAAKGIDIVDDPLLQRAPGSRPFDGEGLRARRNVVVENGVLKSFLFDSYSARKLGRASTGSAVRSGGSIGAGTSNFLMQPGALTPEAIIAATPRGLYVTELMGHGFNPVTGDFSRGASGLWIEDGKLSFPVGEITISSSLDAMLKGIDAIGNDLTLKTSTAAPTFRVASMTISGT
ncbi:MAG TPA: metallopeptidase TldD-related protein, partial [Polyangiaceae bacterium]|nr:metallopeptidase TldD-related protein [Polyangiaceae bacterium]